MPTFTWAAQAELLNAATVAAITGDVYTRRYRTTLEELPLGEPQSSVSRSAVSRPFVALNAGRLAA